MKRPKIDLSKEGIKEFFFRHGEKVFFGAACALILLFFWMGFSTPAYNTTTPSEMLQIAERAEDYINRNDNWEKIKEYRQADSEAVKRIEESEQLDPAALAFSNFSGTAVASANPRVDPEFKPPKDFRTRFFRAQVVLSSDEGKPDERYLTRVGIHDLPNNDVIVFPPEFRYEMFTYRPDNNNISNTSHKFITSDVVVGTALLPYAEQLAEYEKTFFNARGYDDVRDVPEYAFVEVQRKTKDSDWQSITAHVHEVTVRTAADAKDFVDDNYVATNVTLPVPPFLGLDYREFSVHPSVRTRSVLEEQKKKDAEENQSDSNVDNDNIWAPSSDSDAPDKEAGDSGESEEEVAPVRLVRFYDMEPKKMGESYLYRVRVWLRDPNDPNAVTMEVANVGSSRGLTRGSGAGGGMSAEGGAPGDTSSGGGTGPGKKERPATPLSERDLAYETRMRVKSEPDDLPPDVAARFGNEQEEIVQKEFFDVLVPTEWVEAENWVTVTSGFETFVAGPVRPPTVNRVGNNNEFFVDEPQANIVTLSFQDDLGVAVPATTQKRAGSVLNFRSVTNVLHPIEWTIKEVYETLEGRRRNKVGRKFETDAIVLDIMGGERQPFSKGKDAFYEPAEVLLIDRNGNFILRNDMEDETAYRQANFISEANLQAIEEKAKEDRGGDEDDDSGDR